MEHRGAQLDLPLDWEEARLSGLGAGRARRRD